jgi:LynF/TruF/PatF family peptide O-prenyltransferase
MMNYQIVKYLEYKRLFRVKETKALSLFEELLINSVIYYVECSNKILNGEVYAPRVNIWYHTDIYNNLEKVFNFFRKIEHLKGVGFNDSILKKVMENCDVTKITSIVCGIDFRENLKESRVKLWFIIKDYPEKVKEILNIYGNYSYIEKFMRGKTLLVGIDFNFDNKTKLKVYARYTILDIIKEDWPKELQIFFRKMPGLVDKCQEIYISFDKNFNKIIHFQLQKPEEFINFINNKNVKSVNEKYKKKGYSMRIISLRADELFSNNLNEINVYY